MLLRPCLFFYISVHTTYYTCFLRLPISINIWSLQPQSSVLSHSAVSFSLFFFQEELYFICFQNVKQLLKYFLKKSKELVYQCLCLCY